ncbi:MAG TPA: divergent polysaccharide deacetylase family protein [bacterium]|nr:divergent polysaccharide deacetylase family protein [bacterium]
MARRRRRPFPKPLVTLSAGVVVLGLLLGLGLAGGYLRLGPRLPTASPTVAQPPAARPPAVRLAPAPRPMPPEPRPARPQPAGRLAVIFDDAGGSLEDLDEIIALARPVTVAVLPGLRYSREVAERARAAGLEVFLHLPLEPEDGAKAMGPGGIAVAMSDAEIEASVRNSVAGVPGIVGVNNHMGSRGTADPRVMRAVLRVVKEENLIFVDSVTSSRTVAGRVAAEMGIRSASRHVFLDNEDDPAVIRAQLRRALTLARRSGGAVAIGHASRLTAQVLREMLDEFDTAGIELVPASALAR